jgi:hypothetical protein
MESKFQKYFYNDTIRNKDLVLISSNPLELSVFVDVYHIESPGNGS